MKKKELWWEKSIKCGIRCYTIRTFHYRTMGTLLVSRKPIKNGYKRKRRLVMLRKIKYFKRHHIKLLLLRLVNKFKTFKFVSQDTVHSMLYKKLVILMGMTCRKTKFLEEYDFEDKIEKVELRKDSDTFIKDFILPENSKSSKFYLRFFNHSVNLSIFNICQKSSILSKKIIIQRNYLLKKKLCKNVVKPAKQKKKKIHINQLKFYPRISVAESTSINLKSFKNVIPTYLHTAEKIKNSCFLEKKLIPDKFFIEWLFFKNLHTKNSIIFSKLYTQWNTICKIFLSRKHENYTEIRHRVRNGKFYQEQISVNCEFSLNSLNSISKKNKLKNYTHKQRLRYIQFSEKTTILAFCSHKLKFFAYYSRILKRRMSLSTDSMKNAMMFYTGALDSIQKITTIKNQKLRDIKTRYFRRKKFIPIFKKKSIKEWSKFSLETKNYQLEKHIHMEQRLVSKHFSNIYRTLTYLKRLNCTKHKKFINRLNFTNLVIKKTRSPFLLFSNSFLTKYYFKRYIINFYNNTKYSSGRKRCRKQKKKIYAFNFWKKKLKVYKNARQIHWNMYTKKTLKKRRYRNFLKPFLKDNTNVNELIVRYFSIKFNFSAIFWQTFTELYFKFFHKTVQIKQIYQFPISLVFWQYLKKNQSVKNKIKIKIKHWLTKSRWIRRKFWMNTRRNLPKFFFQQTFFDKTILSVVQFDFKTSSLCILKNIKPIIDKNGIIRDNKMLKLHNMRYKS